MLKRVSQIGVDIEAVEGVAQTLAGPTDIAPSTLAVGRYTRKYSGASASEMPNEEDRGIDQASLTQNAKVKGSVLSKYDWTEEMLGGDANNEAEWGIALKACGWKKSGTVKKAAVTVVAGAFTPGQAIGNAVTLGASTKVGFVYAVATIGVTVYIWFVQTAGVAWADTDDVYDFKVPVAAHGTITGAPTSKGHEYSTFTETGADPGYSATVEFRDGDIIMRGVGCRGQAKFMLEWGKIPKIQFHFEGPTQFKNEAMDSLVGGLVANVPAAAAPSFVAGKVNGVGVPFLIDNYSPVMTQMTIDCGTTLAPRQTITGGGVLAYLTEGTNCGYAATRIGGRKVSASIDPEYPARATYDFASRIRNGTLIPMLAQIGTLRAAGNQAVVFYGAQTQLNGEFNRGQERNGISTIAPTLDFVGEQDGELKIAQCFV